LLRRKKEKLDKNISNGPGKVCQALGISKEHYGVSLTDTKIWLEKTSLKITEEQILATPRIGIDYAEEDKLLPWRFVLKI
jgi:DNA-3-methyladenine glycosylase